MYTEKKLDAKSIRCALRNEWWIQDLQTLWSGWEENNSKHKCVWIIKMMELGKQHLKKTSLSTNNADSDASNGEDVNEIDEANETLI